ncbi:aldehyde dehydrogenase family protein [Pseudaminobacter sp. NGMCC 1.201702]|uniref:aldehyde dehydrogenase family protein n=1 Tax=Pseudaminobacter sp. NGMCC 1.201702 TaxID=3391825 RepID=UPI0039F0C2B3
MAAILLRHDDAVHRPNCWRSLDRCTVASTQDLEIAVEAARRAQQAWWLSDDQDRARILRRIADEIRLHANALGTLDTLDSGRPIRDTATRDVERAARIFEFFAGTTDRLRGAVVPVQPSRTNLVEYEPIGIVGAITPWNYPLTNAIGKIAPALATGNAVILKPAEASPLSALLLAWIAHKAGLPAGLLNVLNGSGATIGEMIVRHPDIGKITFTGSTPTGRHIGSITGDLLKSVTLELGGKTGFILFADADLDRAADALVFSAFNNAGQTCTAGSRPLVEASIAKDFVDRIASRLNDIVIGDPLDLETRIGPVISARHRNMILAHLAGPSTTGLKRLELPSRSLPEAGFYVSPSIFLDVSPTAAIAQEEVFGPMITVTSFTSDDEAIEMANATRHGLATTVWTSSFQRARRVSREARSGLVWINTAHSLHPGSPYGGYKQSGVGVEMGQEAVQQHMKIKSVWMEDNVWQSPWG